MPSSYSIPSDQRAVGTPDPANDMNAVADVLGLFAEVLAQALGAGSSADPAGNATNLAAIVAARAAASLAPGAAGTALVSNGTSAAPTFQAMPGGLLNDRGAIAGSTVYNPGDMVAYRGQRVLITTQVTSTAGAWNTGPTLTSGTFIPVTSRALYYARDWGVVVDGTTDNGPALNRALQYMWNQGGGWLIMPGGGFAAATGSTVIIPPNCFLVGQGIESTILVLLAGSNCDVVQFMTQGSSAQASIISAATGNTVTGSELDNAFYAGLMHMTVHGSYTNQAATSYTYGVNMTTNPVSSVGTGDPDFDPTNLLLDVECRFATGDGFFHNGRGQLRVHNCVFRYNQGWGAVASPDSLYTGCNFSQNGIGGIYIGHSAVDGAACKNFNNGRNVQWTSGQNWAALAPVMYNGAMYRAINALTSDTVAPSSDPTNWAAITATAPQYWGYGYVWDSAGSECTWAAADSQEQSAGDYYLHSVGGCNISGVASTPNFSQVSNTQNSSNPNLYAVATLDGANGNQVRVAYKTLNSAVYVLRVINSAARNDVSMTGDTTYEAVLSSDSVTLVGSGNAVKVNGVNLTSTLASQNDVSITSPSNAQILKYNGSAWVNATNAAADYLGVFGDGSDGAITLDGTTTFNSFSSLAGSTYTLTRDMFTTTLTINSGVTLNPGPFRIFCTVSGTNNGTISTAGNNGAANGTAGAALSNGSLNTSAGGAGNTGAGGAGGSTAFGANGGAGGTGSSGTAGAAGGASQTIGNSWVLRNPFYALTGAFGYNAINGGRSFGGSPGGGGGGGDGTNKGGGGGGGAPAIVIFAQAFTNTGTMSATGGNGGTPTTGNCGGGGGGGGGLILVYTLSAWTNSGTTTVTAGSAGSGVGTGTAGSAGTAGAVVNRVLQ